MKLTVSVPGNGEVKQGQSLEIGVKVERLNQFTGPVQLGLGLPPQMSGIGGESGIAADAIEGKLTLTATGDAKEGPVAHAVVRATVEHEGRLLSVDAPVTLKISK